MALTGLLAGFNEQRGADTNYLAALDQMRRAQMAQELDRARLQQQGSQFAQELAARQAQQQMQAQLDRERLAQSQAQFGQEFGLRQSADQRAAEQARQQGLSSQFDLSQKQQALGARNALADLVSQNPEMSTKELGLAFLSQGGDPNTGISFLRAAREEEASRQKEQREAQQAARGEWKIFAPEGIRVNTATGEVQKLEGPGGQQISKIGKATEGERSAASLGSRLENSLRTITDVTSKEPGAAKPEILPSVYSVIPGVGETLARVTRSDPRQRVENAQLDALDAALTLTTGAAYTENQLKNLSRAYFPQIGEGPEAVADKEQRFRTLIESARIRAGAAEPAINQAISRADIASGRQEQPKQPTTFQSLPDPRQYAGKTIRDTATGQRLTSDGTSWRRAQ